jgi:hypothetical protein
MKAAPEGRVSSVSRSPIVIRTRAVVVAAGIWDEGHASYPERSVCPPEGASEAERPSEGQTEVSRGQSSRGVRGERAKQGEPNWRKAFDA